MILVKLHQVMQKKCLKVIKKSEALLLEETIKKMDIVISTALIPGKPAQKLSQKKWLNQ